jgi:hypothetical protein
LAKIAYERDPDHPDCWFEPSARVREAAIETLNSCCPNRGAPPMGETPPPPPPEEGGPRTPPVEPGRSANRAPSGKAAMFGGIYGRSSKQPPRYVANYRQMPQQMSQAPRTQTVWVGDEQAKTDAAPARPLQPVQPVGNRAHSLATDSYVESQDAPRYADPTATAPTQPTPAAETPVVASPVIGTPAAEAPVAVEANREPAPYVEPAPAIAQPRSAPQIVERDEPAAEVIAEPAPAAAPEAVHETTEQPALEPIIRQPSNLTLRAKRPALIAATPSPEPVEEVVAPPAVIVTQPASAQGATLIQQPANFGNAVRRASAEEPTAFVADEQAADEPLAAAEANASDATAEAPAARAPQNSTFKPPVSNLKPQASSLKPSTRGVVAKVSASAGTVQLRFAGGTKPEIGSRVQVQHKYLLNTSNVGELEIIAVGSELITARPVNDTNLTKISSGDVVVLQTR